MPTDHTRPSPVGTTSRLPSPGWQVRTTMIATVRTLTIAAAPSTTTLAAASQGPRATAAQYGDTVTLTATIAPTTATGTVVFQEGQNVVGTAPIGSGTGIATLALTTLQAGRHTITATYLGDNNLGASTASVTWAKILQPDRLWHTAGGTQLNARPVPGNFAYSPAAGAVPNAQGRQDSERHVYADRHD